MTTKQDEDKGRGTNSGKPAQSQSITAHDKAESVKKGSVKMQGTDNARANSADPLDPRQPVSKNPLSSRAQGSNNSTSAANHTDTASSKISENKSNTSFSTESASRSPTADRTVTSEKTATSADSAQRSSDPLKFVNSSGEDSAQTDKTAQQPQNKPAPKKSGGGWLIPLIGLLVIAGGGYAAYQYYQKHHTDQTHSTDDNEPPALAEQAAESSSEHPTPESDTAPAAESANTEEPEEDAIEADEAQDTKEAASEQNQTQQKTTTETGDAEHETVSSEHPAGGQQSFASDTGDDTGGSAQPAHPADESGQSHIPGEVVYDASQNPSSDQGQSAMHSGGSDSGYAAEQNVQGHQQGAEKGAAAADASDDSRSAALEKRIAELEQKLAEPSGPDQNKLLLQDVARYIQYADNELQISQNAGNAKILLEYARKRLSQSQNQAFSGLITSIDSDLSALNSADTTQVSDKVEALEQLSGYMDHAPMRYSLEDKLKKQKSAKTDANGADQQSAQENAGQPAGDAKWYDKVWSWAGKGYDHVVSALDLKMHVEKIDQPDAQLLSLEDSRQIRNQIKMKLSLAQQALVARQSGAWKVSLDSARSMLNQYFDTSDNGVAWSLQVLDKLAGGSVTEKLPSLEKTRSALKETSAQLSSANDKPQD